MAILENSFTQEHVYLRITHLFGRASTSVNTVVKGDMVSRVHAAIAWQASFWEIQDSSTNGTFINGEKIQANHKRRLKKNDKIHFGEISEDYWILSDDSSPKPMIVPIGEEGQPQELTTLTVLPNNEAPEVTLYPLPNMFWQCETNNTTEQVYTGDTIHTSAGNWYFVDNYPLGETSFFGGADAMSMLKTNATFTVSQNEEHVLLTVTIGNYEFNLGRKMGHYMLLILARKRLEDIDNNIADSEAGWLDKSIICDELRTEEQYMNIQIYRYRKQLEQVAPQHLFLPQTVERRLGELRLNFDQIDIIGGNLSR